MKNAVKEIYSAAKRRNQFTGPAIEKEFVRLVSCYFDELQKDHGPQPVFSYVGRISLKLHLDVIEQIIISLISSDFKIVFLSKTKTEINIIMIYELNEERVYSLPAKTKDEVEMFYNLGLDRIDHVVETNTSHKLNVYLDEDVKTMCYVLFMQYFWHEVHLKGKK